jgi:hypothetical protein
MNATQKKYAKDKVYSILGTKLNEISKAFTIKEPRDELTKEQKHQQIVDGVATIKSLVELDKLGYCSSKWDSAVFNFNTRAMLAQYKKDMRVYNKARSKIDKQVNVLKNKADEIVDQIYLGDSIQAMDLIKEFNNFKVK